MTVLGFLDPSGADNASSIPHPRLSRSETILGFAFLFRARAANPTVSPRYLISIEFCLLVAWIFVGSQRQFSAEYPLFTSILSRECPPGLSPMSVKNAVKSFRHLAQTVMPLAPYSRKFLFPSLWQRLIMPFHVLYRGLPDWPCFKRCFRPILATISLWKQPQDTILPARMFRPETVLEVPQSHITFQWVEPCLLYKNSPTVKRPNFLPFKLMKLI